MDEKLLTSVANMLRKGKAPLEKLPELLRIELAEKIDLLPQRDREILLLYCNPDKPRNMSQIAKLYDVTHQRIEQIIKRALRTIPQHQHLYLLTLDNEQSIAENCSLTTKLIQAEIDKKLAEEKCANMHENICALLRNYENSLNLSPVDIHDELVNIIYGNNKPEHDPSKRYEQRINRDAFVEFCALPIDATPEQLIPIVRKLYPESPCVSQLAKNTLQNKERVKQILFERYIDTMGELLEQCLYHKLMRLPRIGESNDKAIREMFCRILGTHFYRDLEYHEWQYRPRK